MAYRWVVCTAILVAACSSDSANSSDRVNNSVGAPGSSSGSTQNGASTWGQLARRTGQPEVHLQTATRTAEPAPPLAVPPGRKRRRELQDPESSEAPAQLARATYACQRARLGVAV